ncbi:carboxypeptidase-like regulatory domain-containing protein [Psychroserpens burtonensis]|uniref:Carboxypeptidase-like regulatory domain-containing protein n=1 Tax=Psychroserpens burtonensis TaxID=49278 RepID=A0A5C7BG86_9FLAO|nr:carboxypeptidase-like regulatory domain-containing protein [Psychroserpens burtonensis]TXE17648.1 carboxypeptidase-like regulatory domain-containing protein [Psychroserpens burtonensis]
MKIFKFVLLVSLVFCAASCNKDDSPSNTQNQDPNPDPIAFAQNFGSEISRTFLGTVVDTNNNPIENVMISIGSSTASTDPNGVFIINNATVNERFGYVKAERAGFIHASRAVVPSEGTNKVRITMLAETSAGTTSSGTQETINLQNGASVALEGDYIKPDGSSYSGSVNVIMHHLDPADENMQDQMPGMLYAANAQNEARMLQTFGMLAVELRGDNGEDLNLAEGSSAEITMPLDPSLIAIAPSSIPLWYFDEVNGYWIEDGEATLVGNAYVGNVSHFSFWNCDVPADYIDFCVTVNDSVGNPLANAYVALTSSNFGTGYGYTNENGETCGLVPANETLEINVYSYDLCGGSPIYTNTVGPFTENTSINVTIQENPDLISETVIGTFNDCDGNAITDGYVRLRYGNEYFTDLVTNGDFEINLIRCDVDNTFTLKASDYVNIQETDSLSYTFTTPLTNLGTIQSCNTIEEFITYQVNDHPPISYNFNIQSGLDSNYLTVSYTSENQESYFNFYIDAFNGANTYTNGYLNFFDENFDSTTLESQFIGTSNVTYLGDVDNYIDINFTGVITDFNSSDETPISGTMHVLRDY